MERTGHKSTDGVRSYKRTSENQREALSDILNRARVEEPSTVPIPSSATPVVQTQNIIQASTQNQLQGLNLSSALFSNCTVHFNIGKNLRILYLF